MGKGYIYLFGSPKHIRFCWILAELMRGCYTFGGKEEKPWKLAETRKGGKLGKKENLKISLEAGKLFWKVLETGELDKSYSNLKTYTIWSDRAKVCPDNGFDCADLVIFYHIYPKRWDILDKYGTIWPDWPNQRLSAWVQYDQMIMF